MNAADMSSSPPQKWRSPSDDVAAGALARRRQPETSAWTTAREGAGRYTTFAADCQAAARAPVG